MGSCSSKNVNSLKVSGLNLNILNDKTVPWWSFGGGNFLVEAKCTKVYDGDSLHLVSNFYNPVSGERSLQKIQCRMYGYDTNEIKGGTEETKKMACAARDFLSLQILDNTVYVLFGENDKWGRPLVIIWSKFIPGSVAFEMGVESVNAAMISSGHGVVYSGVGAKKQ